MACGFSLVPLAACTAAAAKILHRLGKAPSSGVCTAGATGGDRLFQPRRAPSRFPGNSSASERAGGLSRRKERSNDAWSPRFAPGRRGLWIAVVRGLPYRPCHEGMWAESV